MRYQVEYIKNQETCFAELEECKDAGMAFARCQKDNPGCIMVHCIAYSGTNGFEACMHHDPPAVQRHPVRAPRAAGPLKPKESPESLMPFFDDTLTHRVWDAGRLLAVKTPSVASPND